MKGYQYRLIISVLVVILVVLAGYSLFLGNESRYNAELARSCVRENQKLFEHRLDPEYADRLEECTQLRDSLDERLGGLESNFTDYCGLFGALDQDKGLEKVESVRFKASISLNEIESRRDVNYCDKRFFELMDDDAFYQDDNYECCMVSMNRLNYNLEMNCICGYYSNPETRVVLPKEI